MTRAAMLDRVLREVERATDEVVDFTVGMIRIPTINPPGDHYEDCGRYIGTRLAALGFETEYIAAEGRPEHTRQHPRVNVVGTRHGVRPRPTVHLNGHFDVVPVGQGWTVDPFAGLVRDGRVYGRGACDMKAGIAAAVYAAEAIRRAGIAVPGTIEVSGTVDEESGGFAGVAYLAEQGRLSSIRTDYCIIPEPFSPDRVCVGHRGVYWFEVAARGHIAHGSMPFLGVNAVEGMGALLHVIQEELQPMLAARRTDVPVVPEGARHATLNINGIFGGQPVDGIQSPCVADLCRAVFDRRFLVEEGFDFTKREIESVIDRVRTRMPRVEYSLQDLMVVHPTRTPDDSPVIAAIDRSVEHVLGRRPAHVASPGTYDHKHVTRIAGVPHCVAYGPGELEQAHQPDEFCTVDDLITSTKVLAAAILDLTGALPAA
ncbi:MAG: acetylornithine deacetylase/succinyl-diaminopimelate desuccinylase family protein [Acidobacteria bacterium]|nr:acetylornithine deacetylase/succinyl-diaminopimelate desuccinylase family protein [Acidobacteriota bacterium]